MKIFAIAISLLLTSCVAYVPQVDTIPYCKYNKCEINIVHRYRYDMTHYSDDQTEDWHTQFKISAKTPLVCICKY